MEHPQATPPPGAVLVRLPAADPSWARRLPPVPAARTLTVTVGHPGLLPVPVDDLVSGGYRVVGLAEDQPRIGWSIDILVPREVREDFPDWWQALTAQASRVFDLRFGPVIRVLRQELALHLGTAS